MFSEVFEIFSGGLRLFPWCGVCSEELKDSGRGGERYF